MLNINELFGFLHLSSTAVNLVAISLTIMMGLTIGRLRFGQVSIGVAGVLFAGILLSQIGIKASAELLDFIREFGLIIFVYTIGVQVGPSFFSNFKQNGIQLNLLAIGVVVLGVAMAFLAHYASGLPIGAVVGILSGATTNTPSLGAAQQILSQNNPDAVNLSTIAYAIAYPMGIFGIIITMLILKKAAKIDLAKEAHAWAQENSSHVVRMDIKVENKNIDGITLAESFDLDENQIIVSRLMHNNEVILPHENTVLSMGDVIRAVGPRKNIEKLCRLMGSRSQTPLEEIDSDITGRWMVITNIKAVGKTIESLDLRKSFKVTATRINHDNMELPASNDSILYYGDSILAVGEPDDLDRFSRHIGNSPNALNHPFILPLFFGMFLGILVGQIPIYLPGLPSPVKIGLAGGPLIVAILASRLGRFGHVVWYLPTSANHVMRKFGISLFLACVGLKSGAHFIETVMTTQGMVWFLWGCAITIVPLILVGGFALWKLKINYLTVCGLLAGSLTDPPALVFANNLAPSNAQSVAYSTIYPMVMISRIITIQVLVIIISMA